MQVGVDPGVNKWDQPFVLGVVDPHDSLSHPAGVSDVKAESATCLDPDLFNNFLVREKHILGIRPANQREYRKRERHRPNQSSSNHLSLLSMQY
jgi:hypothetical protein